MAVNPTVTQSFDSTLNQSKIIGTIALTGNYGGGATNGDTFDITALNYGGQGLDFKTIPHINLYEEPAAGTAPSGYVFTYCPGTTQANGVIAIMSNLTQYTQGSAYNAALLAANIRFEIEAVRL